MKHTFTLSTLLFLTFCLKYAIAQLPDVYNSSGTAVNVRASNCTSATTYGTVGSSHKFVTTSLTSSNCGYVWAKVDIPSAHGLTQTYAYVATGTNLFNVDASPNDYLIVSSIVTSGLKIRNDYGSSGSQTWILHDGQFDHASFEGGQYLARTSADPEQVGSTTYYEVYLSPNCYNSNSTSSGVKLKGWVSDGVGTDPNAPLVTPYGCAPTAPTSCTASIGNPANGTAHYINLSCSQVSAVTGYSYDYSLDNVFWNINWYQTTSPNSFSVNNGDSPNSPRYFRVRTYCGAVYSGYKNAAPFPIYTACDFPTIPTVNNATSYSLDIKLNSESPVANPSNTTYSIYCPTVSLYVQSNGTLGSGAFYKTKSSWGTTTVSGLTSNTSYCFYAFAKNQNTNPDVQGNPSNSACATTLPGCTVPTQATNITFPIIGILSNQLTVNWIAGNGTKRIVYCNTTNNFSAPLNGTDPLGNSLYGGLGQQPVYNGNSNSVTVNGLNSNTLYWFRIYEGNCVGSASIYNTTIDLNNPKSQTTSNSCTNPAAPSSFSVSTFSSSSLLLSWKDNSNNETGFAIERSNSSGGTYSQIYVTSPNAIGFLNVGLDANKTYYYKVRSVNGGCYSSYVGPESSSTGSVNAILPGNNQAVIADPIQLATGSYTYQHRDFDIPVIGDNLTFERFYNSLNRSVSSSLGFGWSHSYDYYVINTGDTVWTVHYGDGHSASFDVIPNGNGTSAPKYAGTYETLVRNTTDGTYTLTYKNGDQYQFSTQGKLIQIMDRNSNITLLVYTGENLMSILAPGGRWLSLTYDNSSMLSDISDPLERHTQFEYDSRNNLIAVTDASNRQTDFMYDSLHQMIQINQPNGNILLKNSYDSLNRVVQQLDAYNNITTLVYNSPNHGDVKIINPDNSIRIVHHDSLYRQTSDIDELGNAKYFTYDVDNNRIAVIDENENTIQKTFDSEGNQLSETHPEGNTRQSTYKNFGMPATITDALGNSTTFTYDSNGNLISSHTPDGATVSFTINSNGTINTKTDAMGNVTSYLYTTFGDLASVTAPNGTKFFSYDSAGRLISLVNENGDTTKFSYNKSDQMKITTDALGFTTQKSYDLNGNLISEIDKRGLKTEYSYDLKNRLVSIKKPNGGITQKVYDPRDNLSSITDANGNVTSWIYDEKNRAISKTDPLGTTHFTYDRVGNKLTHTDATSKTMTYEYDENNRLISTTDDLGNKDKKDYDGNNQLIKLTDPLNNETLYAYNLVGLLTEVTDAAGGILHIDYDLNKNKVSVTDANGNTENYNYDDANRLVEQIDASGNSTSYGYDAVGNPELIITSNGTIIKEFNPVNQLVTTTTNVDNYSFTYDPNGNILSASNNSGVSNFLYDSLNRVSRYTSPFNEIVKYNYDAEGNNTTIIYPNELKVSYTYNGINQIKSVTDWLNQTFNYYYDNAGRMTRLSYPNGINCDYSYDIAGRLIDKRTLKLNGDTVAISTFVLDAAGNRKSEFRIGSVASGLISDSLNYTYSADDKLLSDAITEYSNDAAGNRTLQNTNGQITSFVFSNNNLLLSLTDSLGTISYKYDPFGNRVLKNSDDLSLRYTLDLSSSLSKVLQEVDANAGSSKKYIYGVGLLERIDESGISDFYHFDAQHNTVANSDAIANLTDMYVYDPFGTLLTHSGTISQPFTFLGEYGVHSDKEWFYFIRARYYDSKSGRFLSKDPVMGTLGSVQTLNRYVYALNNPLIVFDFSGFYGLSDQGQQSNLGMYQSVAEGTTFFAEVGLEIFQHFAKTATPTLVYKKVPGGYQQIFSSSGVSFFSPPNPSLSKWGGTGLWAGPIINAAQTGTILVDILVNKNTSSSNYSNLSIASGSAAVGIAGAAAMTGLITTAPIWIPAAAVAIGVGGLIYAGYSLFSN